MMTYVEHVAHMERGEMYTYKALVGKPEAVTWNKMRMGVY
jgi:hypothetical protein